jgi:PAS domain S-box-containing protein
MENSISSDPAVSRRQRFLEAILESATDYAIIAMDLDGLVTSWNEGAYRILGWTEAEIIGQPASVFFTLEDRQNAIPHMEMQRSLQKGRASDERWHQKKNGSCFWASGEMMPLKDEAGETQGFLKILRDRTEHQQAEQRQAMLTQELAHRVKNTLAIVQAISSQTFKGEIPFAQARESFNARLMALSQAHDVLMQGSWSEASLRVLLESVSTVHAHGDPARFHVSGPDIKLGARAALSFALVLHELGTNAVKYGALSVPDGRVSVTWELIPDDAGQRLRFAWRETGGPKVVPPSRAGFGTRLIEHSFRQHSDGTVELRYLPEGVVMQLDFLLASLQLADVQ